MMSAVPDLSVPDVAEPLLPVYPFNEPGQPIVLHDGPVGGLATIDVPGLVEVTCARRPSIEWRVEYEASWEFANRSDVTLLLRRSGGDLHLPAHIRAGTEGWSNGAVIGRTDVPLRRVVAHWFNLPDWHGSELLGVTEDGGPRRWAGRWVIETAGWRVTIDVRPDHQCVWANVHKTDVYVMTHVMELRRMDGADFTATEVEPLLTALHIGVSFALGRWAAPMLPVGQDADDRVVWEEWRPLFCDPARGTSSGWWYDQDHQTLRDFLMCVIPVFADPDRQPALRFEMMFAIMSIGEQGFVEQRVMPCTAGLEHIMWQRLVIGGVLSKNEYHRTVAHINLRAVLAEAKIPVAIEPSLQPSIAQFAAGAQGQGITLDGAHVVTQIRNRLVHPKGAQEGVYQQDGLLQEAWLLSRHYLVLLILHSLGYRGPYRDLRKLSGWASDRVKVPWA
jgi:hypothetical protein